MTYLQNSTTSNIAILDSQQRFKTGVLKSKYKRRVIQISPYLNYIILVLGNNFTRNFENKQLFLSFLKHFLKITPLTCFFNRKLLDLNIFFGQNGFCHRSILYEAKATSLQPRMKLFFPVGFMYIVILFGLCRLLIQITYVAHHDSVHLIF